MPAYFTDQSKVPVPLREHFDKGGQLYQVERHKGRVLLSTTPDGLEHPDTKLITGYAKEGDVLTRLILSDDEYNYPYIPDDYLQHVENGGFILTPDAREKPDTWYAVYVGKQDPETHVIEGYSDSRRLSILQVEFLTAEMEESPEETAFENREFTFEGNTAGHAVASDVQMRRVGEFSVMDDRTFLDTVLTYYKRNDHTPGNEAIYNLASHYDAEIQKSGNNPCFYHDGKHPCMDPFRTQMYHMFAAESIKDVPVNGLDTAKMSRILTSGSHDIIDHEEGQLSSIAMHMYQNNLHVVPVTVGGSDLVYEDVWKEKHLLGRLDERFLNAHRDMDGRQGFLVVHDPDNGPYANSRVSPDAVGGVVFDLSRPMGTFKVREAILSHADRALLDIIGDKPLYMKSEPKNGQTIVSLNPDSHTRNGYEAGFTVDMDDIWQEVTLVNYSLPAVPPVIYEHVDRGGKLYVQGMPEEGQVMLHTEVDGMRDFQARVSVRDIHYVTLEDEQAADLAFADALKNLSDSEFLKL